MCSEIGSLEKQAKTKLNTPQDGLRALALSGGPEMDLRLGISAVRATSSHSQIGAAPTLPLGLATPEGCREESADGARARRGGFFRARIEDLREMGKNRALFRRARSFIDCYDFTFYTMSPEWAQMFSDDAEGSLRYVRASLLIMRLLQYCTTRGRQVILAKATKRKGRS